MRGETVPEAVPAIRRAGHHSGWKWLLPAAPVRRVLCVERGGGGVALALAASCEELLLVSDEAPDWLAGDVAASGARLRRLPSLETLTAPVDAVVLDALAGLPAALLRAGSGPRTLRSLLRQIAARLAPDGFLFLLLPNAWSHRRFANLALPGAAAIAVRGAPALRRGLVATGFGHARVRPLAIHGRHVHEVLIGGTPAGGRGLRGVARRLVLGAGGRVLLAPAYAATGARRPAGPTRLEALLANLVQEGVLEADAVPARVLVLPTKLVVSLDRPGGGRVLLLPDDPAEVERRRREGELLAELACRVPEVAELLPVRHLAGGSCGSGYVLLDRIDGECIDADVPELESLTDIAVDFLCAVHGATRRRCTIAAGSYARRFGALFRAAAARHPGAEEFLARLDADVRELVIGRSLPLVFAHGDFKIENLVFDRCTRRLQGVIDWELAERDGLPLLDLLYLLLYNRTLRGESFAHAYRDVVLHEDWRPEEMRRIHRYLEAVPLRAPLVAALEAMLLVHALARRLRFDMRDDRERRQLLEMLAFAAARVGRVLLGLQAATGTEG